MKEHNPKLRRQPKKKLRVNCVKCQHFFVTWEKAQPYGCKQFGFKGKQMPNLNVKQITGVDCPVFKPKQT